MDGPSGDEPVDTNPSLGKDWLLPPLGGDRPPQRDLRPPPPQPKRTDEQNTIQSDEDPVYTMFDVKFIPA